MVDERIDDEFVRDYISAINRDLCGDVRKKHCRPATLCLHLSLGRSHILTCQLANRMFGPVLNVMESIATMSVCNATAKDRDGGLLQLRDQNSITSIIPYNMDSKQPSAQ